MEMGQDVRSSNNFGIAVGTLHSHLESFRDKYTAGFGNIKRTAACTTVLEIPIRCKLFERKTSQRSALKGISFFKAYDRYFIFCKLP